MDQIPNEFTNFKVGLETSRTRILSELSQAEDITFFRGGGNIGDHLIWAGTEQLLQSYKYKKFSHKHIEESEGHTALITGSGGWSPSHHSMPKLLQEIEKRFERVIILPSSYDPAVDVVKHALSNTKAKVFVREMASYSMIKDICNAELAYDCAFFFDFTPYQIEGKGEGELLAFRTDEESASKKPANNYDISNNAIGSNLDRWLHIMAQYETIRTDRAHIMVAGAMLGKTVYYTSSNYHKIPGMARFSLREFPVYPETSER